MLSKNPGLKRQESNTAVYIRRLCKLTLTFSLERQTFCTNCKKNVPIAESRFKRLAIKRAVIEGYCSICGMHLLKAKVMPKSSFIKVKRRKTASLVK